MNRALTSATMVSDVNVRLPNPKEPATCETSDVIGKCKLLVDTNAEAGDRKQINGCAIDHDDGSIASTLAK